MTGILREAERKKKARGGRKSTLSIEDRLLMTLEYLREYRTYVHISQRYGLSESTAYDIIQQIENTLIKHADCALPGRKALLKEDRAYEVVLIDATETQIERPQKKESKKQAKDEASKEQAKTVLFGQKEATYVKDAHRGGQKNEASDMHCIFKGSVS